MNLHQLVRGAISSINPDITGIVMVSTGSTVNADYVQVPRYAIYAPVTIQQQAVSGVGTDGPSLQHLDAMGIQGTLRSFFMSGNIEAVNRVAGGKGGDLIITPATILDPPSVWLNVQMVQAWSTSGWCQFIGQLQPDAPEERLGMSFADALARGNYP